MWRWLLITLFLLINTTAVYSAPKKNAPNAPSSSSGPTSAEEADVLWREGNKAVEEKKWNEALISLERLVHRYPASPRWIEAHLWLGKILLNTGTPHKAITPLKTYVNAVGTTDEGIQGKLLLGEAFLNSRKFSEAFLIALELLSSKKDRFAALLLKTNALIGLNQDDRAILTLTSIKSDLSKIEPESTNPLTLAPIKAQTAWLDLKLKTRYCARFPKKDTPSDESQTRKSFDHRGTCLLEASLLYFETLKEKNSHFSEQATHELKNSFQDFKSACKNPPPPLGKRTPKETAVYRKELIHLLNTDCQKTTLQAIDLLNSLKGKLPSEQVQWIDQVNKILSSHEATHRT